MAKNIFADIGDRPYEAYFSALGEFIHFFSRTEYIVLSLLHHLMATDRAIAVATTGSTRLEAAKDTINRILEARRLDELRDRLAPAFAQLGVINGIRNNVVHWGAIWNSNTGRFDVSNALLVSTADRWRKFHISVEDFEAMVGDLMDIGTLILVEINPERENDFIREKVLANPRAGAWRYKPPPRSPAPKPKRGKARPQSRPPETSPG